VSPGIQPSSIAKASGEVDPGVQASAGMTTGMVRLCQVRPDRAATLAQFRRANYADALGGAGAQLPGPSMAKSDKAFPRLATKRLKLRAFAPRDLQSLHACFGDEEAMRYWNAPACKSEAETKRWLKHLAKTTSPYDHLAWAVAEKRSDRCIGMVNYHHREARNAKLEIGYILAPARQGRGLMTEAVAALVAYCFKELSAHRIEALIHPDNVDSIRLVERLGFRCEGGPLRDRWRRDDGYMSVMMYARIAGEQGGGSSSR
jgi:[ribosomal protein S5]-alanine N-acetyltransferase